MSDIEELLKKHVGDVDKALEGFEGKVSSLEDLVKALDKRVAVVPAGGGAVSRLGGPRGLSDALDPTPSRPLVGRRQLSISEDDRKTMGKILRGNTAAMAEASDPDGGIIVPEQIRAQIETLVLKQSPIRRLARVVDLTTGRTVFPINLRGTSAGWVGENEPRVETSTPTLAAMSPPGGTLYALPSATEELVDDAIVNLEQFLEENVVDAMAEQESRAFIYGDGLRKPAGFLAQPITPDGDDVRPIGTLQDVAMPVNAGTLMPGWQFLVAMIFSLKAAYRAAPGTSWLASTDFISRMAQITDEQGKPFYVPSLQEGVPGMMLGYPVTECEHMPAVAVNAYPLAFGNWQRGYVIGDRTQLNVLRDPYTVKGRIQWYFRKRVYGSVLNTEAIKIAKALPAA
jgi:HK97 family phage major capsid protein